MSFPSKYYGSVVLLIACNFVILRGLDLKPRKGETCSFGGPSVDENGEENPCFKDGLYSASSDVRLPRRDPVAVDHVQTIQVDGEKTLQLKTRSVKPPLFEIPGMLSDEECDHLVELANTTGLEDSTPPFKGERVTREGVNSTLTSRQMGIYCKRISRSDTNKDGNITVHEFNDYVYRARGILVTLKDVWNAYETLLLEGASYITYENCTRVNRTQFVEFVYRLFNMYRFPYYNERYSTHTWVEFSQKDPVLERIKRRVAEVTQMSALQIEHSEDLQVVKYRLGGHYYAHYDSSVGSEIQEKRCCQRYEDHSQSSCLICRYLESLDQRECPVNVLHNSFGLTVYFLKDVFDYKSSRILEGNENKLPHSP